MNFLDIQSWWEIPCIAHFCSLFRSPFNLPEFDIEDLEEALLADGTSGDTPNLLSELVVSLLKGCDLVQNETITTSNYQMFLRRVFRQKCKEYCFENTFDKDIDFQSLPLRTKIINLHLLCDIRLDSIDVGPIYSCLEPESLRVVPLGYDSKDSTYWYFHGTRLYREDKLKPVNGGGGESTVWQVICFTEDDWNNLTNKLKKSRIEKDRALRQLLETDFLPKLPQLFKQKERLRRKKLIQLRGPSYRLRALAEAAAIQEERKAERERVAAELLKAEQLTKHEKNRADRARRRSRSSSIQSIISTYASSSSTAHSSDSLFQSNKYNYIVHSRSTDSDSDNNSITSTQKLNQTDEQHWSSHDDIHDVKRLLQKYNLKKEDKENINTITLSTDSSDTDAETTMPPTNNTNAKLPGRQTNNSLSSLTGNIFIPPFESGGRTESASEVVGSSRHSESSQSIREEPPPAQPPRKKKVKSSEVFTSTLIPTLSFTETEEVLQIGMHKVLEYVKNHKDAWPFMDPVEEDIAPRYYSIIRRPMDLLKMEEKLDNGEYQTFNDFRNDFKLIVNNCRLYNGQNNEYTEMVNNLQLAFEKSTKKYFEQNSSDEEINLEYPDLKTNVFREKNFNAKNMTPKQLLLNEVSKKMKDTLSAMSGKKVSNEKEKISAKSSRDESRDRDAVNTSRGIKRKRKDKDKRRKKKPKMGKNSKHYDKSTDEEDDDSAKSDDSEDEDEPPVKVTKRFVRPATPEKKSKEVTSKNKKGGVKAKQKSIKKGKISSDDENSEEDEADDVETDEEVVKNVPLKSKKNSKNDIKLMKNETKLMKNETKPRKSDVKSNKSEIKPSKSEMKHNKTQIKSGKSDIKSSKSDAKTSKSDIKLSKNDLKPSKNDLKLSKNEIKVCKTDTKPSKSDAKLSKRDASPNKSDLKTKIEEKTGKFNLRGTAMVSKNEGKQTKVDSSRGAEEEAVNSLSKIKKTKLDKSLPSKKPGKMVKAPVQPQSENESENDSNSEMGSDEGVINYPMKKKSKSSFVKAPHKMETSAAKPSKKDKKKMEKENQNFKSKRKNEKTTKKDSKKRVKVKSSKKAKFDEAKVVEDDRRYRSSSRSVTPVFTVDLHKKYSKSASIPDDTPDKTHTKTCDKELMSISSRSFSRSVSPLASHYSSNQSLNSLNDESRSPSKSKKGNRSDRTTTPDIKDKFDLIKERRSRNNDEKWNQIVKEAEKIKDKTASNQSTNISNVTLEKNQKLKETIEKLKAKAKNKTSKERAGLLNEIFGAKPTKEVRDERSIFERLRDTNADTIIKPKVEKSAKNKADEYNFVEDVVESKPTINVPAKEPTVTKAKSQKKLTNKVNAAKNLKSTNMEALEMETEQTLKDINRWLEHTPRFPDFGSASNSPSRYNLLDDFDAVTAKLEADFRRPEPSKTSTQSTTPLSANIASSSSSNNAMPTPVPPNSNNDFNLLKETPNVFITLTAAGPQPPVPVLPNTPRQTIQLQGLPPAPGTHKRDPKEPKRKTLKEKLNSMPKRKDLHRTIERLQPGKAKGNLIGSNLKSDDPNASTGVNVTKPKEIKNSLLQPTVESGPKLSLGSVLDETGFGLGQQHNFGDEKASNSTNVIDETSKDRDSDDMEIEEIITSTEMQNELAKSEKQKPEVLEKEASNQSPSNKQSPNEKPSATPNLSAWFKAFGAPKKTKKSDEEETLSLTSSVNSNEFEKSLDLNNTDKSLIETSMLQPSSPTEQPPGFMLPTPRTRKASTNSTVSERSSFSQDPDSPRVPIDERIGSAYGATYPSPLSASPLMTSPKDELPKPSSPYPMNGAIKVGFYQDTTTKSSPEKSCSPREPPSPYNYAQNLYSSASASVAAAYGGACSYNNPTEPPQTATLGFNNKNKTPSYYDQYKQPRSQDSDYNSSMSPNPNSPYQNQQQSPYQQPEASPYQQPQSSPYQQPHSPFHQQPSTNPTSTQQQATTSEPTPLTQFAAPNSPYQQQTSPYQQPNSPMSHMTHLQPQQQPQQSTQPNFGTPTAPFSQSQQQTIPKPASTAQHQHAIGSHQSPNFHSNPSSPYSQHDPNSPYSQQGPISPYNALPNSPKSQQQQQQTKPNHSQQDWNNSIAGVSQHQQQLHQPPNPMEAPKISNSMADQMGNSYHPIPAHMTNANKPPPNTHGYHMPTYANPYAPPSLMDQLRTDDPNIPKQSLFNATLSHPHSPNNEPSANVPSIANMGLDSLHDNRHMNLIKSNESSVSPTNRQNQMHQNPRDLVSLGFPEQNLPQPKNVHKPNEKPLNTSVSEARSLETPKPSLNTEQKVGAAMDAAKHQQQVFDHLLGTIGFSKNLGFGKAMDISTSKALEMFNRAATMGFPKGFPTSAGAKNEEITKSTSSSSIDANFTRLHSASPVGSQSQKALFDMINMGYQQPLSGHDLAKPINMVNNAYNHQQMLAKGEYTNNLQSDLQPLSKPQHSSAINYPTNLTSQPQKTTNNELTVPNHRLADSLASSQQQKPCELNVPNLQRYDLSRQPHSNIDLTNYKSSPYNSPGLDPNSMRKMEHMSVLDENLLGLQSSTSYYQKDIPPAHMYSKNIPQTSANLQQMLSNSMTIAYNTARDQQMQQNYQRLPHGSLSSNSPNLGNVVSTNQASQHYMNPIPNQPVSGLDPKVSKRTKKKKTPTPTPSEVIQPNQQQNQLLQQQHQHQQQQIQQHQQQQQQLGFQSYAGLKSNPSSLKGSPAPDPSLALKTATANMVPGSAFNFGPTPTAGLGLYGEQTGYLDEFRGAANPYYLPGHPTGHRGTTETPSDKLVQPPTPSSTYHQFLPHPSSRTTYPFMNAQLDPNSQIYQQYFQRQEELRTARLMLNQGLLSHGAPGAYPQSGYLGMHKSSFDAMNQMNRPSSWFP